MTAGPIDEGELRALRELSAALGRDPLRTQGAGGNTSIKHDGVMWIKASGTWLAEALAQNIMTPVRLDPLRKAIADGDPRAATAVDFVDPRLNTSGLRPSIETSVHAVIPAPVVVHIHCVNTIALAVRSDGEALIRKRLSPYADLVNAFVPYRKPGLNSCSRNLRAPDEKPERLCSRQSWSRRCRRDGHGSGRSRCARMRRVIRPGARSAASRYPKAHLDRRGLRLSAAARFRCARRRARS